MRNCPLLCASPGVAALFKFADGIDEIDVDGAAPCSNCGRLADGGCAECGVPTCSGPRCTASPFFDAEGCSDVVRCTDCRAHLCLECRGAALSGKAPWEPLDEIYK